MEKKEVKFSLVFRDMWQSAGKYVPRVDQLVKVAPPSSEWDVSTAWKPTAEDLNKSTCSSARTKQRRAPVDPAIPRSRHTDPMLDRALNGLRMSPVPADVRRLFYKVKKAQGNRHHPHFLRPERHPQHRAQHPLCPRSRHDFAMQPLHHPLPHPHCGLLRRHGQQLIDLGCDEICLKRTWGISRP